MPDAEGAADDGVFDALLNMWLVGRDGRIGVKIASEFARLSHPWERPGIHDSLHGVLEARAFAKGSGDFFETASAAVSGEAGAAGGIDREVLGFFVLAAFYAAAVRPYQSGPTFVRHPITVAFRMIAAADELERRCMLGALDGARQSLEGYVDWNGQRCADEAALANLGWTAAKEAVIGEFDDAAVDRVAEEFDRQQPAGFPLFMEGLMRKCNDRTRFIEALAAMLGERWESPAWQMVRHVLTEPRR